MPNTSRARWCLAVLVLLGIALAWPVTGEAQTVNGQARAVRAEISGPLGSTTTALADTGTLSDSGDAREASLPTGSVAGLLSVATLHAVTIGGADQVSSEASVADLRLAVGGTSISADFVMSRARASSAEGAGATDIEGLSIGGVPIDITGEPNQTIAIPGGTVVINERQTSAGSAVVNALHIVVSGVADVVIASATARLQ